MLNKQMPLNNTSASQISLDKTHISFKTKPKIFAIDSIYNEITPKTTYTNIYCEVDIFKVLSLDIDVIFMSDVLHHLDNYTQTLSEILKQSNAKYIVIKDIDANYKFGDFMNKMHDFIINSQKVASIFPQNLLEILTEAGFVANYFYLPKIWYPHFLIIASLKKEIK